mgnify:CR=1
MKQLEIIAVKSKCGLSANTKIFDKSWSTTKLILELVYQSTVYFWEVVVDGGSLAVRLKNRTS